MMHIIQTTSSLAPEFGGPARSIPALGKALAELGHEVTLVHLDFGDSFGTPNLPSHPGLQYCSLAVRGRAGMRPLWIPGYRKALIELSSGKSDLIFHNNGIWLPHNGWIGQVAKRMNAPLMITIHGMLEPWALGYGRLRKQIAWHLYQKRRLKTSQVLHATSEEEARQLRKLGLMGALAVIPNGTRLPDFPARKNQSSTSRRRILFLSRIHPKKGLLNLVEAVSLLDPDAWEVVIAGYDENNHQQAVEQAVRDADLQSSFHFLGPIADDEKWDLYSTADLFVLPSFSENFGIVVVEALASGVPVITTQGTPWQDLIAHQCGWWVEPTVAGIYQALQEAVALSDRERIAMGESGRRLVENKYSWPAIARQFQDVYQWMLGKRKRVPDQVIDRSQPLPETREVTRYEDE